MPAGAALALLAPACFRAPALGLVCASLLVASAMAGTARLEAIDAPGRQLVAGSSLAGRAQLLERPRPTRFGSRAVLRISSGPGAGARLLARTTRELRWPARAGVGAELQVRGLVRRPHRRRDAPFDFATYLHRQGIAAELWLTAVSATGHRRGGVLGAVDGMRRRAERAISAGLPAREAALLRGMVLGQDELIDEPTRDDWRAAGLAHLLAVSGQNVMLLAALALPLLAVAGMGPGPRTVALLGLIAIYVPLAGAGPSLQRAGVMGAAGLLALAAARPASRSYALLLAAAATLALNPRVAGDPGWQLSFAAVAGIIWIAPTLRPALRGLPAPLAEGTAITVAATLATAPLLAHHFGSVPLASVPANLLALPAVPLVMWAGMLMCALGQIGGLSKLLAWVAGPALDYLAWLARTFAELPGSAPQLPLGSAAAVAGAYLLMGGALLGARAMGRRLARHGGEWAAALRRMGHPRRLAVAAALAAPAALVLALALRPPPAPAELTVTFLDVGQGDATLVQHPDGTAILFDGGPPEARTARLIRRAGVRRLTMVVVTHASRDHHGGLHEVIERFPVELLLDGGDGSRDPSFRALLAEARRRGIRRVPAIAPLELRAGGLAVRVLSPRRRPPGPLPEDPNLRAVVAVVSASGFDLLLSADAESEALAPLALPDVEAMKVPHHGSADPGLPGVLRRLRPEVAAIEVGANTYGHPAPSTLASLRREGVRTYRTDRHGSVRLTAGRDGMRVRTERSSSRGTP